MASALEQRRKLQAALERAKQAAEETASFKSRFLAVMSHEIRSPLASMTLLASALRRRAAWGAEGSDTVEAIERVSRRVLDLLDGVLSYSKHEAVGIVIARAPTDVGVMMDELVSMLSIQAAERGVSLDLDGDADAPSEILIDRARVEQVLGNLVSNALRHARGRVRVSWAFAASAERVTSPSTMTETA